jgi:hypothetical protein
MELTDEQKKRLYSIFKEGVAVTKGQWVRKTNSSVLLVDGT